MHVARTLAALAARLRDHLAAALPREPALRQRLERLCADLDVRAPQAQLPDLVAQLLACAPAAAELQPLRALLPAALLAGAPVPDDLDVFEPFLALHDPELRGRRGVYYTPPALVDYLVRSLDHLLDLTDPTLQIVDPAAGTGAFLDALLARALARGARPRDLLARLRGFELLPAACALAHLRLRARLARAGHTFAPDERPHLICGDALGAEPLPAAQLLVLGNPPWAGHSQNHSPALSDLLADYKREVPGMQRPGQAKWLHDDYIKFIRLAQQQIDRAGRGALAFVTSHTWLASPTFRGMRRSLLASFDELWLLDLHGNTKRRELPPDGARDDNVFPIQQGAAICLLVKHGRPTRAVRHADLWGPRAHKLATLAAGDITTTTWTTLDPLAPEHLLVPRTHGPLRDEFMAGWSLPDIFSQHAPGVLTTHDALAISWTPADMIAKVERLLATRDEAEARRLWTLCSQDQWNYARALRELSASPWRERVVPILYRPFDLRHTVYDRNIAVHRRERVSDLLLRGDNLALLTTRQTKDDWGVLVARHLCAHKSASRFDITSVFPLRLEGRRPNLDPAFLARLPPGTDPERALAYIYAVLHAPGYRRRYRDLLAASFARVPLTASPDLFARLAEIGARLIDLHTGTGPPPAHELRLPVADPCLVERLRRDGERVWINRQQFFEPVPEPVWTFTLGGHLPAQRWLRDRAGGPPLSADDLSHYRRLVGALLDTLALMRRLDDLVDAHGGWPLA